MLSSLRTRTALLSLFLVMQKTGYMLEYKEALAAAAPQGSSGDAPLSQLPLPSGLIKVFCDGAFHNSCSKAAVCCALFEICGKLCDGLGKRVLASSALVAEFLAIQEVCSLLLIPGVSSALIASDSKVLISVISADLDPP